MGILSKIFSGKKEEPAPRRHNMAPVSYKRFYAGVQDRLTNQFEGSTLSINEALKKDLNKMRARSRELWNDNDYAKKFINMVKSNVVGAKGVRMQAKARNAQGKPDKLDNDAIEAAWKDFSKRENFSANGRMTGLDMQRAISATVACDGEVLIRVIKSAIFKYGIAFQQIDVDRLDTTLNKDRIQGSDNRIVMSVELDPYERPVAYYIMNKHPSEGDYSFNSRKYSRYPADEIIHEFISERADQVRGIPWMHASIRRMNMVGGYEEAELVAARAGASKMGFYYSETGEEYIGDDTSGGYPVQQAEPGTFEQLPAGIKFEAYDPQHPTGAFNYFMRGALRGASAGLNVAYTSLTGDLEAVNYSSIRAGLIEERENWRMVQGWFVEHIMQVMYEKWLGMALARGLIVNAAGVKLPLSKKEKFTEVRWQARGWAWVDPLKDQQANDAAVEAGHKTNTQCIAESGNDIEEVYETLAWERELAAQYGLEFNNKNETGTADDEEDTETKPNN